MKEMISNKLSSSVRPVVTILFTVGVWVGFFLEKVDGNMLLAVYGSILGFWFGERGALKIPGDSN
jgi:uncharacterized membrane protein YfcA